jgi:hypothetical protein
VIERGRPESPRRGTSAIGTFREVPGLPHKIQSVSYSQRFIDYGLSIDSSEIVEAYNRAKYVFEKMGRSPYDINIPTIATEVKPDNDGVRKVFVIMDRIEGVSLRDALRNQEDTVLREKTSQLIDGLSCFMSDTISEEGDLPYDLKLEQFIYGKK